MYTCSLENNEVKAHPLDVYIFLVMNISTSEYHKSFVLTINDVIVNVIIPCNNEQIINLDYDISIETTSN